MNLYKFITILFIFLSNLLIKILKVKEIKIKNLFVIITYFVFFYRFWRSFSRFLLEFVDSFEFSNLLGTFN
jgi:hypothetical protein